MSVFKTSRSVVTRTGRCCSLSPNGMRFAISPWLRPLCYLSGFSRSCLEGLPVMLSGLGGFLSAFAVSGAVLSQMAGLLSPFRFEPSVTITISTK